eukprot:1706908-Pyramimonas_sp.AAC.1
MRVSPTLLIVKVALPFASVHLSEVQQVLLQGLIATSSVQKPVQDTLLVLIVCFECFRQFLHQVSCS